MPRFCEGSRAHLLTGAMPSLPHSFLQAHYPTVTRRTQDRVSQWQHVLQQSKGEQLVGYTMGVGGHGSGPLWPRLLPLLRKQHTEYSGIFSCPRGRAEGTLTESP